MDIFPCFSARPRRSYQCNRCGLLLGSPQMGHACSNSLLIGKLIKALREQAGLNQRDLATRIGVSHVTVGNWERGDRVPTLEHAEKLMPACTKALGKEDSTPVAHP